jgi:hypothetical protein
MSKSVEGRGGHGGIGFRVQVVRGLSRRLSCLIIGRMDSAEILHTTAKHTNARKGFPQPPKQKD